MPLTAAERQELDELRRMDELEAKYGKTPSQATAPGAAQSALEGFGQTASMGYLPQLQAGAEKGIDKLSEFFGVGPAGADAKLREQGFQVPEKSYVQMRDEDIARHAAEADQHPLASNLGKGAGIAATSMLPIGSAAKAGTIGQAALQGARAGAAQGLLYNPGDTAGVVDPIQAKERIENAGVGAVVGAPLGMAGYGVGKLADKSRMVDRVKDSAGLSRSVKQDINEALEGVNNNYIAPRAKQVRAIQAEPGMTSEINPERLKGISPGLDALASKMEANVGENGRRSMNDLRADRLRRLLDARAGYNAGKPYEVGAAAKGEAAKSAADILRKQIKAKPGVAPLKEEIEQAIALRNALSRSSDTAPIASIKGAPGTDKGSLIDAIDKMGGSKLKQLSEGIQEAKDLIMKPSNFIKPLEAPNEFRKAVIRGAAGSARAAQAVTPKNSLQMALKALFETKR